MYHNQLGPFICKLINVNTHHLQNGKNMIISKDIGKALDKIQHAFMMKHNEIKQKSMPHMRIRRKLNQHRIDIRNHNLHHTQR